jgi:hypothetical protein
VSNADQSGKSVIFIDVDRRHQIESQQRQVGEVVLRQLFAAKMCVDAAQTAKATFGHANAFEVRKFNAAVVADGDILNVTLPINERTYLAARLMRQFTELASKLGAYNLIRLNSARIELFNTAKLIRL